eukprot:754567-Hanusia_phi.AAC.4
MTFQLLRGGFWPGDPGPLFRPRLSHIETHSVGTVTAAHGSDGHPVTPRAVYGPSLSLSRRLNGAAGDGHAAGPWRSDRVTESVPVGSRRPAASAAVFCAAGGGGSRMSQPVGR